MLGFSLSIFLGGAEKNTTATGSLAWMAFDKTECLN